MVLAVPAAERRPPPLRGSVVELECEDFQEIGESGDPDSVDPFYDRNQRDWFRVRLALADTGGESLQLRLREVAQESSDPRGQRGENWPARPADAGAWIATAGWNATRREWAVRARAAPGVALPELITAEFLRRMLAALVARPPVWNAASAPVTVTRSGRWRRIGAQELWAEVTQEWSKQPPLPDGLIPAGWRGPITIIDPEARAEKKRIGSGTAGESGSIDPEWGLYQDLVQSWDVRFKTGGGHYAWRHRCATRVVPDTPSPPASR